MKEKTGRHVPKFTQIFIGLVLLSFLLAWMYKFGLFNPTWGTSLASASALWGQFLASFLAIIVFCGIVLVLDIRPLPTRNYKLVSFWILTLLVVVPLGWQLKKPLDYGTTHTYRQDEEFNYLDYSFKAKTEFQDYQPKDCSQYNSSYIIGTSIASSMCERDNERYKDTKHLLIHLTAKNKSGEFKHFTEDWFSVIDSVNRRILFMPDKPSEIKYEIPSHSENTVTLKSRQSLDNVSEIHSIIIKIDNHAEQYININ
ncbi:MAG: hypothetical protein ABH826_02225 [Patescibacteria group bacterium]